MTPTITPTQARTMLANLATYCRDQAKKREAEGRHDVARGWRLEAQQAEARAVEIEAAHLTSQCPSIAAAYEQETAP
jgi:hypothetical protein